MHDDEVCEKKPVEMHHPIFLANGAILHSAKTKVWWKKGENVVHVTV
jgi:hypothetical protein